jgi:hypothetical protein
MRRGARPPGIRRSAAAVDATPELDPERQDRVLVEDIGMSVEIVARLRAVIPGASIG